MSAGNTNISAHLTQIVLVQNNRQLVSSMMELFKGMRIASAAYDEVSVDLENR